MSKLSQLNHQISLEAAVALTSKYKLEKENILKSEYQGKNLLLRSEAFSKSAYEVLLAQPGAIGIRTYFGMQTDNTVVLVMVAVNDNDDDILGADAIVMETGQKCPPNCDTASSPL